MKDFVLHELRGHVLQPLWQWVHRRSLVLMNFWASHLAHDGEVDVFRAVARDLSENSVLFDVGANVGDYSALMSETVPGAEIHAFEPSSAAFAALQSRFANAPAVHLNPMALSREEGQRILHSDAAGSTIGSLETLASPIRPFDPSADETVRCETLDGYCGRHGIDRIDWLKIDVEGHELAVLEGAAGMLAKGAIHGVQWEFGENNLSSRTFLADFVKCLVGFDFYRVVPGGLVPWTYAGGQSEIFATMNYVALRKGRGA